jgi:predicted  nucleic acid-binding Zn-ribbon protein
MADEKECTEIKVDIQTLKRDIENVNNIQGRLDTAIDKLTDVSSSIKSMLAVHEEKLTRQEKIDEVIFEKLKDRADEISDVYRELKKDIELVEKRVLIEIKSLKNDIGSRVGVLERYRWLIMGGAIVIGWILSKNFVHILNMMNGA